MIENIDFHQALMTVNGGGISGDYGWIRTGDIAKINGQETKQINSKCKV